MTITVDIPRQPDYTVADLGGLPGWVRDGVMVVDTDLTVEQVIDLYPESPHVQLIEGRLVVSPAAAKAHQRVMFKVGVWLDARVPEGWMMVPAPNVRVSSKGLPIPDIAVVRGGPEGVACDAADVALVVEVLSPKTRRYDEGDKLAMWLAVVPCVWLIDPHTGELVVHSSATVPALLDLAQPPCDVLVVKP